MNLSSYSLLAVHAEKYKRAILSRSAERIDVMDLPCRLSDITPLHADDRTTSTFNYDPSRQMNLFQLLKVASNELLREQLLLSKNQFAHFIRELINDIRSLYAEILFYVGAVKYADRIINTGLPVCFAEIMPPDEKIFSARKLYHPALIEYRDDVREIVSNDIDFTKGGEILILTGLNQGGKTTFLRAVGSMQFLFQLGLPLPAESAYISPVEAIVSAFSQEENTMLRSGKLGQELNAVREAIELAPVNSLILFNEPITGTSPMESLILSRKILAILKVNGYHGIWVTHLFELAEGIEAMNESLNGSVLSSLIISMSEDSEHPSYKVVRGKPVGKSYAREIFERQNIFEQDVVG